MLTDAKNSKVRTSLSPIIGLLHLATLYGHLTSKLQLTQPTLLKNSKLKIYQKCENQRRYQTMFVRERPLSILLASQLKLFGP